jgi:DNA polymerase III subunit delta
VAAEELKPVYLLTGSDRPKIERALRRLRDRFDADAVELLGAHETSGADAVAASNSLGLFGGDRLVVVEGVERWKAEDAKAVAAYAADPTPGVVLALVAAELRKDSTLTKAVAKVGAVLVYDVDKKKIVDWLVQQFGAHGVQADRDFCRSIADAVVPEGQEPDLHHLANEVAKLVTWAGGEPLTWDRVRDLVVPFGDVPSFALTDAWGRRDVVAVLAAAEASFERESSPRRDVAPRLVGALGRHLARLRECRALLAEGRSSQEIASSLKRHPYYVQKLVRQAEAFTDDELRDAALRLAELDHALKGGSRLAGDLELERALVDVTRGRQTRPTAA